MTSYIIMLDEEKNNDEYSHPAAETNSSLEAISSIDELERRVRHRYSKKLYDIKKVEHPREYKIVGTPGKKETGGIYELIQK